MANIKTTKAGKQTHREGTSLLTREKRRLRTMQIAFALFCSILILSMVLSLVVNS